MNFHEQDRRFTVAAVKFYLVIFNTLVFGSSCGPQSQDFL